MIDIGNLGIRRITYPVHFGTTIMIFKNNSGQKTILFRYIEKSIVFGPLIFF